MCTPTAITAISLIGTGISAFGQLRAASAAAAESDFRSDIAANNANIANQNADLALDKGAADAADKRAETRQAIGLQRAQLAGAGFSVEDGSSIEILTDTAVLGDVDVLRIEADAENRAANFRQQGSDFAAESELGRFASKSQKKSGIIGATGTLITGAVRAKVISSQLNAFKKKKP